MSPLSDSRECPGAYRGRSRHCKQFISTARYGLCDKKSYPLSRLQCIDMARQKYRRPSLACQKPSSKSIKFKYCSCLSQVAAPGNSGAPPAASARHVSPQVDFLKPQCSVATAAHQPAPLAGTPHTFWPEGPPAAGLRLLDPAGAA